MNRKNHVTNPWKLLACIVGLCSLPVLAQETTERFRPGEWEVSPFLTYVDKSGDHWGLGGSVTYFLTKNLGVGGSTYWTDFSGAFFDNLYGEAYFRLPIGRKIAPYVVGSGGYVFETREWSGTLGAGVDVRLLKRLSAFGDIQGRFVQDTRDGVMLRLGARFSF